MTNKNIEGKVVVITGASSGLGEATARLLSSEGASPCHVYQALDAIGQQECRYVGFVRDNEPAGSNEPKIFVETDASRFGHLRMGDLQGFLEFPSNEPKDEVELSRATLFQ